MVFPIVLAVGALALYFLTKPKKSDSDIYSVSGFLKDDKPKNKNKDLEFKMNQVKNEKIPDVMFMPPFSKIKKDNLVLFSKKNSDGFIFVVRNAEKTDDMVKIGMIDNSHVKPTYGMFNSFTKNENRKPYTKDEEMEVKEKIESIIKNHEEFKLKNKSTRKEKTIEEKKTKRKLTNKELKEKLDKVLQFHKKSNQFQKDGKYAYFKMGRLDSSTWFRFGNITKSGNVVFYDYVNQKEDKKIGKVLQDFKYVNYKPTKEKTYRIMINFSGYAYFLDLDKKPLTEKERNKENYDSIMNS